MVSQKAREEVWKKLLSPNRLSEQPHTGEMRTEFARDFDRIIFSSAFRRLQDKTQVFPLSTTDYTRTRLTHSLEVASVGRSLGYAAGAFLATDRRLGFVQPADTGSIVATACLAHDIGNPPFGHSGEDAFQEWAANETRITLLTHASDFTNFEGNAQTFRTLVRLLPRSGGVTFTLAVLGTASKYPCPSSFDGRDPTDVAQKKFGYFAAEAATAKKVFADLGLPETSSDSGSFQRHPLAFLMEAADDVCYRIVDLEDSYKRGLTTFKQLSELLMPIAKKNAPFKKLDDFKNLAEDVQVYKMRSASINVLTHQCLDAFKASLDEMESGNLKIPLIERCKAFPEFKKLKDQMESVYSSPEVVQVEAAGFRVIAGLLNFFSKALLFDRDQSSSAKVRELFPREYLFKEETNSDKDREKLLKKLTKYCLLLRIMFAA